MLYVLQVLTGKENYVAGLLEDRLLQENESTLVPTCDRMINYHGQLQVVMKRLFPGYIFILSDDVIDLELRLKNAQQHQLLQTLTKLLRTDQYYTPLAEEEELTLFALFGRDQHIGMSKGIIVAGRSQHAGMSNGIIVPERDQHTETPKDIILPGNKGKKEGSTNDRGNSRLIVTEGPLMGWENQIVHIDRHKRLATLQINMWGRKTKINLGLIVEEKN